MIYLTKRTRSCIIVLMMAICLIGAAKAQTIDTLRCIPISREMEIRSAVSVNGQVWVTGNNKLLVWKEDSFLDISQPDEDYDIVFASRLDEVWVHVYLRQEYRYVFRKINIKGSEDYHDPEGFPLITSNFDELKRILVGGIVGTSAYYDGNTWRSVSAGTNQHILDIFLTTSSPGWMILEVTGASPLQLFQGIKESQKVDLQFDSLGPLASGVWFTKADRLKYFSNNRIINSYRMKRRPPRNFIPFDKRSIFTMKGRFWHGNSSLLGDHLIYLFSEDKCLRLYDDGSLDTVSLVIEGRHSAPQFYFYSQFSGSMSAVGTGFLNEDNHLDLYLLLPEHENRLMFGSVWDRLDKDTGKIVSKYNLLSTPANGAIEKQVTPENKRFYDHGVLIADFDNDDDQDIFLTAHQGQNIYFQNIRKDRFVNKTEQAGLNTDEFRWSMATAGDADNDGDLDLFITREYTSNMFYLNNGYGYFTDATKASGLTSDRGGMGCTFGDINNDGFPDLFVANWKSSNRIYLNTAQSNENGVPIFTDITLSSGIKQRNTIRSNAGIFADINNDGALDLYVVNRNKQNELYINNNGKFEDITSGSGLNKRLLTSGAVFIDFDNDGFLDIMEAVKERNLLYKNLDGTRFKVVSHYSGMVRQGDTQSIVSGDFDWDGDLDIFASSYDEYSILYMNQQDDNRSIELRLKGVISNRDAIGGKVLFYESGCLGEENYLLGSRTIEAGSGLASTNSKVVHFGVGDAPTIDIEMVFPSGIRIARTNVAAGSKLTIDELVGKDRLLALLKYRINFLFFDKENRTEFVIFLAFILVTVAIVPNIRSVGVTRFSWFYLAPVGLLGLFRYFLSDYGMVLRMGGPAVLCLLVYLLILSHIRKGFHQKHLDEILDRLWEQLFQFHHGEWARSNLNQIQWLFKNYSEVQNTKGIHKSILSTIDSYVKSTFPAVRRISRLASNSNEHAGLAGEIQKGGLAIYRHLEKTGNRIKHEQPLELAVLKNCCDEIQSLKSRLSRLADNVEKRYLSNIREVCEGLMNSYEQRGDFQIKWNFDTIPSLDVRTPPWELIPIIDNLIQNARSACMNRDPAVLIISGRVEVDRLYLHFADSGNGVDPDQFETIFDDGVTTSKEVGRGRGLYFSKKTLKKYGGDVYIAKSDVGKGSEFILELDVRNHSNR